MALASWRYHAFLSFRGEDTRNTFVSHLYHALHSKGIYAFRDDRELQRGKSNGALIEAIRDSRISIVVLSQNYAYSTWCLDELNEIIQCKEKMGQIVIPVFYKVDPSDVRKVRKGFAEAFMEHEEKLKDMKGKLEAWRAALVKVAAVSGWHFQDGEEEASFVGQIVADILEKVSCAASIDARDLVGMSSHVMKMEQLLRVQDLGGMSSHVKSKVTCMVGIWGMGGIGKTTIARVVYDKLRTVFGASWFLEDVGYKFKKHGAAFVIKELLSNILKVRDLKGWHLDKYSSVIKDRLCKKDVLIVLDNVDDSKQLEVLAKSVSWFGPGSRIIITTRDIRLLLAHEVNSIYEPKPLGNDAALQLFSQHAFNQNHPKSDYLELSYDFVSYARGIPLALTVLGSSLFNRSQCHWQEELDKLGIAQNPDLYDILKMSYDGLNNNEREVFLDIACFFNGNDKDRVRDILDACGFFPDSAFEVLKDKALLNISNNKLHVHELLRDMAREIVQQESKEIGERSRLWDPEHIYHVLSACIGTKKVEGIFLELSKLQEMEISFKAFSKMLNLRLLQLNNPKDQQHRCNLQLLHGSVERLSGQLRYLHWHAYPSRSWVPNFVARYLVELDLPNSNVEQLWLGKQHLANLKFINLSYSKLIDLPDLSEAKKLKTLKLPGCSNLVEVLSLQFLTELEHIDLSNCSNLEQLSEIPKSVKYLYLAGTALKELPESLGYVASGLVLDIRNCIRLQKLPNSIVNLESVESLDIAGCLNLLKLLSTKCSSMLSPNNFPDYSSPVSNNIGAVVEVADSMEPLPNDASSYKLGSTRTKENEDPEAAAIPSRQCIVECALTQEVDESNLNKTYFDKIRGRVLLEVDAKLNSTSMILENGCKDQTLPPPLQHPIPKETNRNSKTPIAGKRKTSPPRVSQPFNQTSNFPSNHLCPAKTSKSGHLPNDHLNTSLVSHRIHPSSILSHRSVSVFVCGYPYSWDKQALFNLFKPHIEILDIVLPQKTTCAGKRFGFIHVPPETDTDSFIRIWNGVSIGYQRLIVDIAKRQYPLLLPPSHSLPRKPITAASNPEPFSPSFRDGRDYAEVVKEYPKPQQKQHCREETHNAVKKKVSSPESPSMQDSQADVPLGGLVKQRGMVFKDDKPHARPKLLVKNNVEIEKKTKSANSITEFQVDMDDISNEWLWRSAVAFVRHPSSIINIFSSIKTNPVFSFEVRVLGGDMLLLTFPSKEDMDDFIVHGKDWWDRWFQSLAPWELSIMSNNRLAWIRLEGVPLVCWNNDFFNAIGSLLGIFLSCDEDTSDKKRLDCARILILTSCENSISKSFPIQILSLSFNIRLTEEPGPMDSLFYKPQQSHLFYDQHKGAIPTCDDDDSDQSNCAFDHQDHELSSQTGRNFPVLASNKIPDIPEKDICAPNSNPFSYLSSRVLSPA